MLKLSKNKDTKNSFLKNAFFGLIIVMSISIISRTIVSSIDSFCVSYFLGDSGLAAVSLFTPLNKIIAATSSIFAIGATLIITKLFSRCERSKGNNVFTCVFIFISILSIILFILLFFLSNQIARGLSLNKTSIEVINLLDSYIKGHSIGVPFMFIYELLFSLVYLDNDKKNATTSIIVLFISNIALDFVFGHYFNDKAFGISLAFTISYVLSTIVLLLHFISKKSGIRFTRNSFKLSIVKDSFVAGFPVGVKKGLTTIRGYIMNLIIIFVSTKVAGVSSELVMAANQINTIIEDIFTGLIEGLVPTIIMLGNIFYSEEDEELLNQLLKLFFKFVLYIGVPLTLIYFFLAPYSITLWTKDPTIIEYSKFAIRCSALSFICLMISSAFVAFFQSFKNNYYAILSSTLKSFVIPLIFVSLLSFSIGLKGIWMYEPISYCSYVILHLAYVFIKNKNIKIDVRHLFFFKKDFGYKKEQIYEKQISGIQDTYSVQKEVHEFCNKFNIDSRRKENLSNCAEELVNLIIMSGFSKYKNKRRKPYIALKVLYKESKDLITIRTRDNCSKFDIKEKIIELKEGKNLDLALNCSLKMIIHMSKDVEYSQILKANNTLIKV